jgi:antitoxin component YwqK of YwqJK toxin-antitoxin module
MASKATKRVIHYKDGSVQGQGSMKDGEMHGYWEWFRKDGTKLRSGHFDRGTQVGEWITYDRKGKPYKTTVMDR